MRIGVDVRIFDEGRQSGVEQYAENILRGILSQDTTNEYVFFSNSFRSAGHERIEKLAAPFKNVSLKTLRLPNKVLNSSFVLTGYPHLDSLAGGVDVFFSPNIKFGSVGKKAKHVVTFHDLSFELYPEFYSLKKRWWHKVVNPRRVANEATCIIAVSAATARDLKEHYGIDDSKIAIIHSGAPHLAPEKEGVLQKWGIAGKYMLFFATLEPRKNMQAVLQAYEIARKKHSEKFQLVFAGATGWLENEIKKTWKNSSFAQDILFTGPVSEEEKSALYKHATALLYVSLYEGFGFPPLEAMQAGTPVITSNSSSLPEVVGNAALMVDPHNAHDIAEAIFQTLTDPTLAELLKKRGLEQVKKFSWNEAAKKTLEVLTNT
jgi:glycosyltransferase involved in cell wall biosynthesis